MLAYEAVNTDILALLHAGPFETPMWSGFLERLRERTHADRSLLILCPEATGTAEACLFSAGTTLQPEAQQHYRALGSGSSPIPYRRLRYNRTYSAAEFVLPGSKLHEIFHDEFLLPHGLTHQRILRISSGDGMQGWIAITSPSRDFSASADAMLSSLAPHLSIALQNLGRLERERSHFELVEQALHRQSLSWLTLDGRGTLADIDPRAASVLTALTGRAPQLGERLQLGSAAAERKLADALSAIIRAAEPPPCAVRISEMPPVELLLRPLKQRPLSGSNAAVLAAYLRHPEDDQADEIALVMDFFGLTNSEARLALRLKQGRSLTEAADDLGLTIETARNYSKKIFSKTDTRGQPDLVRTLLRSVTALA